MSEPQSGEVIKRYLLFCKNPQSFQVSSYFVILSKISFEIAIMKSINIIKSKIAQENIFKFFLGYIQFLGLMVGQFVNISSGQSLMEIILHTCLGRIFSNVFLKTEHIQILK